MIGYVACAGVPLKLESEFAGERSELWLKLAFIVLFFRGGGPVHRLDHLDEQGTWFTSKHFHMFLNCPQYEQRFIGGYRVERSPHKTFLLISPLRGGIFNSTPSFEFCRAQTCPCHFPDDKLLNWPDQLTVLRLLAWDTKAKNKTDMMLCVYWGLLVQNIISFISKNRHMWAIMSNNKVEDRERRDIPFPI